MTRPRLALPSLSASSASLRVLALAALLVTAIVLPPVYGNYLPQQLTSYLIFGLFALSVGLITGYARLFNIGAGATFGLSAYTVAILTQRGVYEPLVLCLCSIAVGLLISFLFGLYATVASGLQYMMLTFLTTLACFSLPSVLPKFTGGDNGLSTKGDLGVSFGLNPLLGNSFYFFVLGVVVVCLLLCWYVLSSQAGKAMRAIGRNPVRASAMGYQVGVYRVAITLFSGFIGAVAGWLYALQNAFVFQDLLGLANSLNGLLYALIGGVDSILGPILGAAGLRYFTETVSKHSTQSSLYIGVALLLVVYLLPDGVAGLVRRLWLRAWTLRRAPREARQAILEPEAAVSSLAGEEEHAL